MPNDALILSAADRFAETYATGPDVTAYAPGRVNLLGEHTDYNGGYVLPMPLTMGVAIAMGKGGAPGTLTAASTTFDGTVIRSFEAASDGSWTDYVLGALVQLLTDHPELVEAGLRVMIASDLPVGSGLSSSAAVEVATLRAATDLFGIALTPVEIAQMARRAENDYVGMPCGIMDQYSVSVGTPGHAVFLDTRKLTSEVAPLPQTHALGIVHSGVGHKLTDDGYATRVAECKAACAALGVEMLSDLTMADLPRLEALEAPLGARARHIVTENDRVARAVAALKAHDTDTFARLMVESHHSQRDDYEVSVPQVDALVDGALEAGATGARLTGGGFGGSIVALVPRPALADWAEAIRSGFPEARILATT